MAFWGEQQAIVTIVAVACIFYVWNLFGHSGSDMTPKACNW
jgi:hypothetical protein